MTGFVFFDTETTGLDKGFCQIVHFAAIHTDHELNEIQRFEAKSRLQPHVVPHPLALLINSIGIDELTDRQRPSHYAMIEVIHHTLDEWSPAIFVGYNSISFDEEMLRHGLFQSLRHPYLTSGRNCGRADAFSLAHAAHALPPRLLKAPLKPDGRKSFRLADIAAANGLRHDKAHEALSDVAVTLDLCRMIRDNAPDAWQRFQRFSNKAGVAAFVESEDGFILTEFFDGEAHHRPVGLLGPSPRNANGRLCLNLNSDPERLAELSDDALRAEICRRGSPVRRLAVNAAPTLTELWVDPTEFLGDLDLDLAESRAIFLKVNPEFCRRIIAIYTASWEARPLSPFPELQIYDGFTGDEDRTRLKEFHNASPERRLEIVRKLDDRRLAVFGRRLIHAEHRSSLPENERLEADLDLVERLLEDRGGPLTLPAALTETESLLPLQTGPQAELLLNFREWLADRIDRAKRFRDQNRTMLS